MILQLAIDLMNLNEAKALLAEIKDKIDIVELGTPLMLREGMRAVREVKSMFPELCVLSDIKIMDGGEIEAGMAFEAGADIVTVLGVAHDSTILGVVAAAKKHANTAVMVDMIAVNDLTARAREVDAMGVDYICVHTAFDLQGMGASPVADLLALQACIQNARPCAAGGITLDTVREVLVAGPEIIVVGGGIIGTADRVATAREFRRLIDTEEGI